MPEIKTSLYPCQHCKETGTCTTGKDGASCLACINFHKIKEKGACFGLACGTCLGIGKAEPKTDRVNKRMRSVLSLLIVYLILVITAILGINQNPYFTEFLVFAGTIIGSITAFYYSNTKNN